MPAGEREEGVPAMMQELLRERFGLEIRKEDRIQSVYPLTVENKSLLEEARISDKTKPTFGVQPGTPGTYMSKEGEDRLTILTAATIQRLCLILEAKMQNPVDDQTQMAGIFNITLRENLTNPQAYTPDPAGIIKSLKSYGLTLGGK
jgi:uncharacterized protein (TIGR03435 family)